MSVFWRDLPNDEPDAKEPQPRREELCTAPLKDIKERIKKNGQKAWRWDHLEKGWQAVQAEGVYPGLVLMVKSEDGGYDAKLGWDAKGKSAVPPVPPLCKSAQAEGNDSDPHAEKSWQTLAEHTDKVVAALEELLKKLPPIPKEHLQALRLAARWHDAGKAHIVFQDAMTDKDAKRKAQAVWAKTILRDVRYDRRGFRHELASALAMLQHGLPDLSCYLAAAHHGKVRLSIRSLPHEKAPDDPRKRFARGLWDDDLLASCDLGDGVTMPETSLNLGYMELGEGEHGPSWLARTLALRDDEDLGPFRLAYLEALLRVADWRGSEGGEA